MGEQSDQIVEKAGAGSFCIPRPVIDALMRAQASAYEICAYLTLACFTTRDGIHSSAGATAVNRYTGANKGKINKAIARLTEIHAYRTETVANGRSGKSHALIQQSIDIGPILYDRDAWLALGHEVPDAPVERGKILHVLPDFGTAPADRVWFGKNLVTGVDSFDKPLKTLKNAGDPAARLLLLMYAANDMENWGGVAPIGPAAGPWQHYEPVSADVIGNGLRIIRAKSQGTVAHGPSFSLAWPSSGGDFWAEHEAAGGPVWAAFNALLSSGLIYEVVMVLNRNAVKTTCGWGHEYSSIPPDAEPLYELDCRSQHGYKPKGEEGLGWATAKTAYDLGASVALPGGHFDGTYAAIVQQGFPAMIAGIYRPRFRVSNPKNAGIKGAWGKIFQNSRDALELIQRARELRRLPLLKAPKSRLAEADSDETLFA